MAAINTDMVARSVLVRRENWAQQEVGVVLVFCMVFVIAVVVIGVFINKKLKARKQRKAAAGLG